MVQKPNSSCITWSQISKKKRFNHTGTHQSPSTTRSCPQVSGPMSWAFAKKIEPTKMTHFKNVDANRVILGGYANKEN